MYKVHFVPEGPGSELDATGETPEAAVRAAYRAWLGKDQPGLSEEDLDEYLVEVKIRNGCIYDRDAPCGDVGPVT